MATPKLVRALWDVASASKVDASTRVAACRFLATCCSAVGSKVVDGPSLNDAAQFVVLIDCRAGKGWPNHGATAFWPLIRELARTVPDCYPERLRCVVVYPLPRWARVSLATATYLLPAKTRQKVWAVAGDDSRRAPVPEEIREKAPIVLSAVPAAMSAQLAARP